MKNSCTVVIIPARSGSKSIKNKNIQVIGTKSLLQHSIDFAKNLDDIDRILVSTDSEVYAAIARRHGAWVPFLRPVDLSLDLSKDLSVMQHATRWVLENVGLVVTTVVWLRPSYPFRDTRFVNEELRKFKDFDKSCSARTIRFASESPYKMWSMKPTSELQRVVGNVDDDLHNSPRQVLPTVFWQDGYIDFYNSCYFNGTECDHDILISGLMTPAENLISDIDHKSDFERVSQNFNESQQVNFRKIDQIENNEYSS